MRTTLDLPDDLFRQLKTRAAVKGTTIKTLLTRYIENGLRQPERPAAGKSKRSALPVIRKRGKTIPSVTAATQAHLEEGEDLAKLRRSFGR